jgi:hypothetical protein
MKNEAFFHIWAGVQKWTACHKRFKFDLLPFAKILVTIFCRQLGERVEKFSMLPLYPLENFWKIWTPLHKYEMVPLGQWLREGEGRDKCPSQGLKFL